MSQLLRPSQDFFSGCFCSRRMFIRVDVFWVGRLVGPVILLTRFTGFKICLMARLALHFYEQVFDLTVAFFNLLFEL